MVKSCRVFRERRQTVARPYPKPGYAELTLYGAHQLPREGNGRPLWKPIDEFLDQLASILRREGEKVGPRLDSYAFNAVYTFELRRFLRVDHRRRRIQITDVGRDFISDTLEELTESGQTFSSDLDRFRGTCAALKKALGPIQRLTKQEIITKYECLCETRAAEGLEVGCQTDGTNATPGPSTSRNPVLATPAPPLHDNVIQTASPTGVPYSHPFPTLDQRPLVADPRQAYPSPESAARPLARQPTSFYSTHSSPSLGSRSQMVATNGSYSIEVDDPPPLQDRPPLATGYEDLVQRIRKSNKALGDSNKVIEAQQEEIKEITKQAIKSQISRTLLERQLHASREKIRQIEAKNESDAARIRELQETIRRNDIQSSMRGEELDRLNELLEERTNKVEEYQLRISTFENIMRPALSGLIG